MQTKSECWLVAETLFFTDSCLEGPPLTTKMFFKTLIDSISIFTSANLLSGTARIISSIYEQFKNLLNEYLYSSTPLSCLNCFFSPISSPLCVSGFDYYGNAESIKPINYFDQYLED